MAALTTSPAPPAPVREQAYPDELQAYRKMVAQVAAACDGKVIVNRSEAHAAVVIEHVFRSAKDGIDILTGQLYSPIYGNPDVISAAVSFFETNPAGRMNILSEKPIASDHPLIAALNFARDRIDKRVMEGEVTPFHFAVADARCFRFEPDKNKYEAYGQFGEPETGARLKTEFQRLHSSAPITP